MKIKVISLTEEVLEKREYQDVVAIEVDGERKFRVCDGEPEDNNLSRNFSDVTYIPNLMKMAYEAGKKGEKLEIEYEKRDEI